MVCISLVVAYRLTGDLGSDRRPRPAPGHPICERAVPLPSNATTFTATLAGAIAATAVAAFADAVAAFAAAERPRRRPRPRVAKQERLSK